MSLPTSTALRRSKRKSYTPLRLQEEYGSFLMQQLEEKDIQRALEASLEELDLDDGSDEDLSIVEHDEEEEEERRRANIINSFIVE